jgi:hypothetical protein
VGIAIGSETWVGGALPRLEDEALLRGRGRFMDDLDPCRKRGRRRSSGRSSRTRASRASIRPRRWSFPASSAFSRAPTRLRCPGPCGRRRGRPPLLRIRYAAVIVSGALAALGGAFLSIGFGARFAENMTDGRGFIALAAVIFGKWRPGWAFAATLLFGFGFALAIPLQREAEISENLIATLPYVLTLIAVAGLIGRSIPPAAVGRPYVKQ